MRLFSTKNPKHLVSLRQAVLDSLPSDGGLYMPERIPDFDPKEIAEICQMSFADQAFRIARHLIGDSIPASDLENIVYNSITFPAPVVTLGPHLSVLELFHGPSLAFKDFGARFMAQLMSYFLRPGEDLLTVLVATSGDTGGAVAAGFLNVPGIEVIILYPSGRVSPLQEKQLTTLGGNIHACEIDGSFDDCQSIVKQAFLDPSLSEHYRLSSANSINIARLIPQVFYYFQAFAQIDAEKVAFAVPSGNFGNLTAGLIAKKMGLPVHKFIAATNANDVVPKYLDSGTYQPRESISTLSNAMDVGKPSNFDRILSLYGSTWNNILSDVVGMSFTDEQTLQGMRTCHQDHDYICDPHGSIGFLASRAYLDRAPTDNVIFLETAHPSKFLSIVENTLSLQLSVPERLKRLSVLPKVSTSMSPRYSDFQNFLLQRV